LQARSARVRFWLVACGLAASTEVSVDAAEPRLGRHRRSHRRGTDTDPRPKRARETRDNGVMRRVWFGLGLVALPLASLASAFGLWLLATPDYDGGRQAVGGMALAGGIPLLIFAVVGLLHGERHRPRPRKR
jgi:hypothetical protein